MNDIGREYKFKEEYWMTFKEFIGNSLKDVDIIVESIDKKPSAKIVDWSIGLKTLCYFVFSAEIIQGRRRLYTFIQEQNGNMIEDDINYDWVAGFLPWYDRYSNEIESFISPKPGKGYRKSDRSIEPKAAK